ncbi:immunoglobulin-like domain-containing protein [Paenibacillus paridis]|uniref:immunoglobulin-like domain-containing protein n=1 Tax=Paenibacillus paridis TaxID=2583376 RepID=UPI001121EA73|nr:immunoglobulin-like domain-containing protein [Paenibacillus paridis]
MSKRKNENHKPLTKSIATVLSATFAATSVISVMPTNIASADEASAIAVVNTAATAADMQIALAQVDLALNLTGYDSLSPTGKEVVAQKMIDLRTANGSFGSQPLIQQELNNFVANQQNVEILYNAIQAVNTAASASALRTALEDPALGLILTTYNNLSTPDGKLGAAQLLLDYRTAHGSFADQGSIQNQFNVAVQATLDNEALAFAVKSVNDATDAGAMTAALEDAYLGLILTSFHNLSLPDQSGVAQQMYDFKETNGAFANKAAIQTKLNALVTQRAQDAAYAVAVQALNNTSTANAMKSAMEASDLGLDLIEYYKLNAAHRLAAAQALLNYKTTNGSFANQSSIQATLSSLVAIEQVAQAVDVVNAAGDASSIKSALTANVLNLSLTAYNVLLTADKDAVSALVLANRGAGFADQPAVQAALDAAVTQNAPMAAVNLAADAAAAESALEAVALGLNQGASYPGWGPADQAAVASVVVANRPTDGYVNPAAVQAAFNTAVTVRTPVAAVNLAANEAATQTALEAAALALDLGTNYNADWLAADRTAVAADVLANRPGTGFVDKAAVQAAFDAALVARASVAAVNTAANDADMQTALQDGILNLDLDVFTSWTEADQKAVVVNVQSARPGTGYVDKGAVQAAFDLALAARADIAAVNIAVDAAAMQAALEQGTLTLNLGATYAGWKLADKTAVATALLNNRPVTGYAELTEIQTDFDAAVLAVAPLANINGAGNASDMQTALESVSLDLTLAAAYTSLSPTSQTAVAAWVLSNRPSDGYTNKTAVQSALDMAIAIEYVNIAVNSSQMKSALEDSTLNLTLGVYASWQSADKSAVAAGVLANRGAGYVDKAAVQTVLDLEIIARVAVAAVNLAANDEDMQTALEAGALSLTQGTYTGWTSADKKAVAAAISAARPNDGYIDKAAVQTAFNNALAARSYVAAVNTAQDAASIQTALEAGALGLVLGDYIGWSNADKSTVAEAVRVSRPNDGFTNLSAVQIAFNAAVSSRSAIAAVNIAADAAEMQTALEDSALGLTLGAYESWTNADHAAVAQSVLDGIPVGGYVDKTAVQAAINSAIAARLPVASVNIAVTAAAAQTALEDAALNLTLGVYVNWTTADKAAVATVVQAGHLGAGYEDKGAVQAAFDDAVDERTPVADVNIAINVTAIQLALENGLLGLDLSEYDALLLSDQWLVADHLFDNRPVGGFTNKAAVQLALDSAIDADATMAAVNLAANATDMETALENVNLGLTLGDYATWTDADQKAVAAYVLANRLPAGYTNVAAVQAAFEDGIEARQPVAAVNIALTAAAAQTALENNGLGLTLGEYATWTTSDKSAVASAVLSAFPTGGYEDEAAIQTAFDGAVTARKPVAAVNVTLNEADVQSALEDGDLQLTLGAYTVWLEADQSAVAAAVLHDRPVGGYADKAAVQTAFDTAITERTAVAAVNLASDAEETQAALEDAALDLTLGAYGYWSDADKEAVSNAVYIARPTGGYTDQAAVQAALEVAINERAAVAAVNTAANATAMQEALEDASLGLALGAYTVWTDADHIAVAEAVLASVPPTGFVNAADVQAALNTALSDRTVVANVNIAITPATIQVALQNVTLGLDLSIYNSLGYNDKLDISSKVLMSRPVTGYENQLAIQSALDLALSAGTLNRDVNALTLQFAAGDTASHVIGDIELPALGAEGSTITWTTDLPNIIAIVGTTGTITRPAFLTGDTTVTLTAELTFNGESKTKEFVIKVIKESITAIESVEADTASLSVGFVPGDSAASVTQNISLPTTGANGTAITWTSTESTVIATNGTVNRPAKTANDVIVTLTATITKDGEQETKTFTVNVMKQTTFTDKESVEADNASLNVGFVPGDSAASVTQNLSLPITGANGTTISWSSTAPTVIAADGTDATNGTVNRPAKTASDVIVTLTATITKGGEQETKTFTVNVLKLTTFNDGESVETDTTSLSVGFVPGDSAASVTQSLSLPLTGANGTTIAWSSSESTVIATNGTVNRPAKTASDVIVTLTATITKGAEEQTKTFTVNVLKLSTFNDTESVEADTALLSVGFSPSDSAAGVTQNLSLPLTGVNGSTIAWSSTESTVIATNGTVNRPAKTASDVIVTLTATITKGNEQETKTFTVNVLKLTTFTDKESVEADTALLSVGFVPGDSATGVTQNLSLPITGANGTEISWSSTAPTVIATNGTVSRPAKTTSDVIVTLTATITKGDKQETKTFTINVLKLSALSDVESVEADKTALTIAYASGETSVNVMQNLTLPNTGANGSAITWSSSNTGLIKSDGTVTRPAYLAGDTTITLTATITKNGISEQKLFEVIVLKNGQTAAPTASSILIMNNAAGQNDLIQLSGLLAGDVVNVYSSADQLIGTVTVASNETSAILEIAQLGLEAGSVKVTFTRGAYDESDKVTVNFAKEGAKPFTISGNPLVTTNGISAKVTVSPTSGTAHMGKEVVVFQLMKGTEPISIVVLEKDIVAAEDLIAHFNVSGSGYSVKVFVVDSYSGSFTDVGNSLASAIVLQ